MNDRTLGYAVITFLSLFILVPLVYLVSTVLAPEYFRTIVFENVNTLSFLKIQDQVRVRGADAGTIRTISCHDGKTFVEIQTRRELAIHQGYAIVAEAKGFMGDRYLEINPGEETAPNVDKSSFLHGTFPLGPPEILSLAGKLVLQMDSLVKVVKEFHDGSARKPSFTSRFKRATKDLDSISASLTHVLRTVDYLVGKNVDTLASFLEKTSSLSTKLTGSVPEAMNTIESVTGKTQKLLVYADTLVGMGDSLVGSLKSKDSTGWNCSSRA